MTCAVVWFRLLQSSEPGETSEEAGSICRRADSFTDDLLEFEWVSSDYVQAEGLLVVVGPNVQTVRIASSGTQTRDMPVLRHEPGAAVVFLGEAIENAKLVALDAAGKSVNEKFFLKAGIELTPPDDLDNEGERGDSNLSD